MNPSTTDQDLAKRAWGVSWSQVRRRLNDPGIVTAKAWREYASKAAAEAGESTPGQLATEDAALRVIAEGHRVKAAVRAVCAHVEPDDFRAWETFNRADQLLEAAAGLLMRAAAELQATADHVRPKSPAAQLTLDDLTEELRLRALEGDARAARVASILSEHDQPAPDVHAWLDDRLQTLADQGTPGHPYRFMRNGKPDAAILRNDGKWEGHLGGMTVYLDSPPPELNWPTSAEEG